jgi:hypothetical protein
MTPAMGPGDYFILGVVFSRQMRYNSPDNLIMGEEVILL